MANNCGVEPRSSSSAEARVWSCGAGSDGQLGNGKLEDELVPQPLHIFASSHVSRIACGGAHAIALTGDGRVLTWGRGKHGQLGHGDFVNCSQPKLVTFLENFTVSDVSAGWNHSGLVTDSGHLFMCGDSSFGQLGIGDNELHSLPAEVSFFSAKHVRQIACGTRHSIALVNGPSGDLIYGFGGGRHGQLGACATHITNYLPVIIHCFPDCDIAFVFASGDHSAALTSNGKFYIWGRGFNGYTDERIPRLLPSSLSFSHASLGWNHALLISNGEVYILGGNRHGMLSSSIDMKLRQGSSMPQREKSNFPNLKRVLGKGGKILDIAAGSEHSAMVTEEGSIMTWGWGEHGQLGLGDTCDQTCPQYFFKGITRRVAKEAVERVRNLPQYTSEINAPSKGAVLEVPVNMLTMLAASIFLMWYCLTRYTRKLDVNP